MLPISNVALFLEIELNSMQNLNIDLLDTFAFTTHFSGLYERAISRGIICGIPSLVRMSGIINCRWVCKHVESDDFFLGFSGSNTKNSRLTSENVCCMHVIHKENEQVSSFQLKSWNRFRDCYLRWSKLH